MKYVKKRSGIKYDQTRQCRAGVRAGVEEGVGKWEELGVGEWVEEGLRKIVRKGVGAKDGRELGS